MKKCLTLVLLFFVVLCSLSGYSLVVSAEEETDDPYSDFIFEELFREEGEQEEYYNPDSGMMFSSGTARAGKDLCEGYDMLQDGRKSVLSALLGNSAVNLIMYDNSSNSFYYANSGSFSGSASSFKITSGKLYSVANNGNTSDMSGYQSMLSFNFDKFYVFKYVHKSGTRLMDDFTFSMTACQISTYTLTLTAGEGGSVSGGGQYTNKQTAVIEAIPYPHYDFVSWSDGNIDNPRSLVLSSDLSLSAEFQEHPKYDVNVAVIGNGTIEGTGRYYVDTKVMLSAVPAEGYYFVRWSDGSTDALKEITVSSDIDLTAYFDKYEPSACKFSTQLLEDAHIFNLVKTVQTAFESGRSDWSDWVIYKKFVWLDWNTELVPYSYEINFPVWSYYEIQSLNDSSLYYRSDIERREGYVTFYTPIFVYDDAVDELVIDSYTQDTFTLVPDVPLQFTDRNGDMYKLTPVTVSTQVMTKKCFGEGYDDAKMQDMQYGVLSQILSFLQNKLTGLSNEQVITNQKMDTQNQLITDQNNKMDTQNQLIQDQFSVNTDDNFGVQGLTAVAGEKMGILSFLGESTYILLDIFDPAGVPEPVLEFPAFDLEVSGKSFKVWDSVEFDLSVLDDYLGGFMNVLRSVTTLMVWLAVINYCIKEFERFWRT